MHVITAVTAGARLRTTLISNTSAPISRIVGSSSPFFQLPSHLFVHYPRPVALHNSGRRPSTLASSPSQQPPSSPAEFHAPPPFHRPHHSPGQISSPAHPLAQPNSAWCPNNSPPPHPPIAPPFPPFSLRWTHPITLMNSTPEQALCGYGESSARKSNCGREFGHRNATVDWHRRWQD